MSYEWSPSRQRGRALVAALVVTMSLGLSSCGSEPQLVRPAQLIPDPCELLPESVVADFDLIPSNEDKYPSEGPCWMTGSFDDHRIQVSVDLASFPVRPKPEDELDMTPFELAEEEVASECSEMERVDAQFEKSETGCRSSLVTCDAVSTGNADLYSRAVDVLPPDVGGRVKVALTYKGPQSGALSDVARRHVAEITNGYVTAPASALTAAV